MMSIKTKISLFIETLQARIDELEEENEIQRKVEVARVKLTLERLREIDKLQAQVDQQEEIISELQYKLRKLGYEC